MRDMSTKQHGTKREADEPLGSEEDKKARRGPQAAAAAASTPAAASSSSSAHLDLQSSIRAARVGLPVPDLSAHPSEVSRCSDGILAYMDYRSTEDQVPLPRSFGRVIKAAMWILRTAEARTVLTEIIAPQAGCRSQQQRLTTMSLRVMSHS